MCIKSYIGDGTFSILDKAETSMEDEEVFIKDDFISFSGESVNAMEVCCNDASILSCTNVALDPKKLNKKKH